MRKLLRRPSPAMIVACLALLVALGGTSVAAVSQLARNSVGTPQLRNGAVTNPKIGTTRSTRRRSRHGRSSARTSPRVSFPPGRRARRGRPGRLVPAGAGRAGRRHRRDHGADGIGARRRVDAPTTAPVLSARVTSDCARATSARSRAGHRGATTTPTCELLTRRARAAVLNAQNQVVGFLGVGDERQRAVEHVHGVRRSATRRSTLVALFARKAVTIS